MLSTNSTKRVTGVEDAPYPAMQVGFPNQPLTHHQ